VEGLSGWYKFFQISLFFLIFFYPRFCFSFGVWLWACYEEMCLHGRSVHGRSSCCELKLSSISVSETRTTIKLKPITLCNEISCLVSCSSSMFFWAAMSCGQVTMSPPPHVRMFPFRLNILLLRAFYEPPTYAAGFRIRVFFEIQK